MTSEELPDFTKLFHQLALTNPSKEDLYAKAILRIESVKKQNDPIAMAHALQITFKKVASEIRQNLSLIIKTCSVGDRILSGYETSSRASSNSTRSSSQTSSRSRSSSRSSSSICNDPVSCISNIDEYILNIKDIIHKFKKSQQSILTKELQLNAINSIYSDMYKTLYINKGDYYDDISFYRSNLQNIADIAENATNNLNSLGDKLFPIPIPSKGGMKKKKASMK